MATNIETQTEVHPNQACLFYGRLGWNNNDIHLELVSSRQTVEPVEVPKPELKVIGKWVLKAVPENGWQFDPEAA